jgi:hypothetical protein
VLKACRKRRIKCDEGKPRCNNCLKSKRQCEGYNQRVIFKEPINAYHGGFFGSASYQPAHQAGPTPMNAAHMAGLAQQHRASNAGGPLPIIAPKPPFGGYAPQYGPHSQYGDTQLGFDVRGLPITPAQSDIERGFFQPEMERADPSSLRHDLLSSRIEGSTGPIRVEVGLPRVAPQYEEHRLHRFAAEGQVLHRERRHTPSPPPPQPIIPPLAPLAPPAMAGTTQGHEELSALGLSAQTDPGYWYSDDEASIGDSEDEKIIARQQASLETNVEGAEIARHLVHLLDRRQQHVRTFRPFADENILATYFPSSTNSPLNDAQTAAVFWYFVNATGPCMSLYERHALDPAPMFQGRPVPKARQHIWTYRFPIIALNHPALLQAILALGSLQMANVEAAPPTAAMKHYHLSLRRIAKNYESPIRRGQPATLAATLLLGFYEVWNSDHEKWCKHMWGARAIIKDIPFPALTRAMIESKRRRRFRLNQEERYRLEQGGFPVPNGEPHEVNPDEISSLLIRSLTGRAVIFEEEEESHAHGQSRHQSFANFTESDMENYENLRDLYWWYCKMDVYQSILGATKLL